MHYVFAVSNALTIQGHNILDSRPVYRTRGQFAIAIHQMFLVIMIYFVV